MKKNIKKFLVLFLALFLLTGCTKVLKDGKKAVVYENNSVRMTMYENILCQPESKGLIKEYNKYIETLDNTKLTSKIILDACLNIFVYMRNNDEFEDMDDIFEALKSIFYIFLNQLFILKTEKENDARKKNNS